MHVTYTKNRLIITIAVISAALLTFSVITPAIAEIRQEIDTRANCAAFQYSPHQGIDIKTVEETGLVHVRYTDDSQESVHMVLNYKSKDGFADCSDDAKDLLTRAKMHADKTRLDTCTEFKGLLNGSIPIPEDPDMKFNLNAARQYVAEWCQDQ